MCSDFYLMLAEESLLNKRRQESETDFDFVFKKNRFSSELVCTALLTCVRIKFFIF